MTDIFVRPATPDDASLFFEWQKTNPNFDPAAARNPDSFTLVAFDSTGVLAFLPVQQPRVDPFCLESIAFRPELTDRQQASAMREFIQAAVTVGFLKGTGEILFFGDHPETNAFAERHGFEKMPWPVYRMKLKDL
jgi:hypothetical protein